MGTTLDYIGKPKPKNSLANCPDSLFPDPREDLESRSLKGVPIKYPLVVRVPNSRIYFLDPPGGLGLLELSPALCRSFVRSCLPLFPDSSGFRDGD